MIKPVIAKGVNIGHNQKRKTAVCTEHDQERKPGNMRATIKDVARESGVSVSAVSMALSDKPSRISKETRQKVKEAAERLRYQPNRAALSLVNRESRMIGIVMNDVRNTHIAAEFMAINRELSGKGYSLLSHILEDQTRDSSLKLIRQIASENVAVLIWAKPLEADNAEALMSLRKNVEGLGIPVITMDDYGFDCPGVDVCFDYRQGGFLATEHLLELGHRKIGCLAGDRSFQVTQERIEGYRQALEKFGVPYDEKLVCYGDYTMESGYEAFSYLMGQRVSAIFSSNDEMAFGIYRAARNYGIRIPADISLVGFDNVPFADIMEAPLTTVRVPSVEMGSFIGRTAMELLSEAQEGERKKILYKPDLLRRGSAIVKER